MAFSLITSTRYDPFLKSLAWNNSDEPSPFFLLNLHLERLREAADKHQWSHASRALTATAIYTACQSAVVDDSKAYKIRLLLNRLGELTAESTEVPTFTCDPTLSSFFNPIADDPSLYGPIVTTYLDNRPTATSLLATTKTTLRDAYTSARRRVGIPDISSDAEVILYNTDNLVTEGSIYNVSFYRSSHWVTPSASVGCLPGVMRRWLLKQGRIYEDDDELLTIESLKDGEWVLLTNGVQGCRLGRMSLRSA